MYQTHCSCFFANISVGLLVFILLIYRGNLWIQKIEILMANWQSIEGPGDHNIWQFVRIIISMMISPLGHACECLQASHIRGPRAHLDRPKGRSLYSLALCHCVALPVSPGLPETVILHFSSQNNIPFHSRLDLSFVPSPEVPRFVEHMWGARLCKD